MRSFTWRPDTPDFRDYTFAKHLSAAAPAVLPAVVDLRPSFALPYDQGPLGSCTANALLGALQYVHIKLANDRTQFSRLFVYYNERLIENTVASDAGAELRDGIKTLAAQGVCAEVDWPYTVQRFRSRPLKTCYAKAVRNKIASYYRITDLNSALQCLASGYPFVFGFSVYDSFESDEVARTGVVPLPAIGEAILGGHAVCAVGYDLAAKVFIVRNSWGTGWGQAGYFTIPFDYVMNKNLADDFWTIRK
jgi:C1A family cysteine protease